MVKARINAHCYRLLLGVCVALSLYGNGIAQYYPAAPRVDPSREPFLSQQLKEAKTALQKIRLNLDLGNLYFNKPLKRKADLKRAMKFAEDASELSTRHQDIGSFNEAQLLMADIFAANRTLSSVEKLYDRLNDTARINLLLLLAFHYDQIEKDDKTEDYKKAVVFGKRAMDLSIRLRQPEKELVAARLIASAHSSTGDPNTEKELLQLEKRCRHQGFPQLHYIYNLLTGYHRLQGNPDKAMYYSLETLKSMKATGDTLAAGDFYGIHAAVLGNNDDYKNAVYYQDLSYEAYKKHAARFGLSTPDVVDSKAEALEEVNGRAAAIRFMVEMMREYPPELPENEASYNLSIGNRYRKIKNYREALKYLSRAVAVGEKNNVLQYQSLRRLAETYIDTHRYPEAKPYLYRMLNLSESNIPMSIRRHVQVMLYMVDSATGDYFSAMKRLNQFKQLNEASVRQAKDKMTQELSVKFETVRKENELKVKEQNIQILRQNSSMQEIRLKQSRLIANITIAATGVLILILLLLYRQYRVKEKTNKIITGQSKLIVEKNGQLSYLVKEKEMLLKEVHHRVKNNLQIMMSLLESQSVYLRNDALRAVEDSQRRIYAMSLLHQKLYQSDDIRTLNMAIYLREFVHYLRESFDLSAHIYFRFEVEPVELSVTQAIPLALIVNEAVTNSIKYAFPDHANGELLISLQETDNEIKMQVADNGVGMTKEAGRSNKPSFGLELMKGLCSEIEGSISFDNSGGTSITVRFQKAIIHETSVSLLEID